MFCPNQKKLQEFMLLRREWFGRVNKEVHAYKTTSADPYGSRDFQEFKEDSSSALKVLYCINQLNEAVHVKAATREYGDRQESAQSGIGLCCRNPYRTFDGKHWCYPDDLESRIDNAEEYTVPRKTAIRCLETGKMYESIADASRDTGINNNSIRAVGLRNGNSIRRAIDRGGTAGGYHWEYLDEKRR